MLPQTTTRSFLWILLVIFTIITARISTLIAQPVETMNAAKLQLALQKLTTLGSVLYVAAHPDDENTAFIAYCANDRLLRTAYLSLTRGDGGQNLIGSEQSELLGIIRTQELLAARRIDGGEQFFTRALDFGYSKTPEETMKIWGRDKILADVVWAIRKFRPDVIVTRFPKTGEGGHGHHTSSAILAEEAFFAAADPKKFPEQLSLVQPWKAKRILWNAWLPALEARKADVSKLTAIDLGSYNILLGKSYTEISAESRSMHKSQGFGSSGLRGETLNYFDLIAGDSIKIKAEKADIFEGVDMTWNRVKGGAVVAKLLEEARKKFVPTEPQAIIPILAQAYREMGKIQDDYWIPQKRKELVEIIRSCAGIWVEAIAQNPPGRGEAGFSGTPGGTVKISAAIVNRSQSPLQLKRVLFPFAGDSLIGKELVKGKFITTVVTKTIPKTTPLTQPYWLYTAPEKGIFSVSDQRLIGRPENPAALTVSFVVNVHGEDIPFTTPVLHRRTDPVLGETYRPFEIVPPVVLALPDKSLLFTDASSRAMSVLVKSNMAQASGVVRLRLPSGWTSEPKEIPFSLVNKFDEIPALFKIQPPSTIIQGEHYVYAEVAMADGSKSSFGMQTIQYNHIPAQTLFPEARAKLVQIDLKKTVKSIGYIASASDDMPEYLTQLGFDVKLLSDDDIDNLALQRFEAIVTGVRAYNTRPRLKQQYRRLMDYVAQGGTLLVQYNTANALVTDSIGPYPFTISRERVTEEDTPIRLLQSAHPLLQTPNVINAKDFEGWVQERGLYFASKWDPRYQTLWACNDTGEPEKTGGMLVAQHGKGAFIFNSYAWFRQFPAGVPGAYRLFVNMLHAAESLKKAK